MTRLTAACWSVVSVWNSAFIAYPTTIATNSRVAASMRRAIAGGERIDLVVAVKPQLDGAPSGIERQAVVAGVDARDAGIVPHPVDAARRTSAWLMSALSMAVVPTTSLALVWRRTVRHAVDVIGRPESLG